MRILKTLNKQKKVHVLHGQSTLTSHLHISEGSLKSRSVLTGQGGQTCLNKVNLHFYPPLQLAAYFSQFILEPNVPAEEQIASC